MDEMIKELKKIMEELFSDCTERNGLFRAVAEHVGVVDTNAVIEACFRGGDTRGLGEDQGEGESRERMGNRLSQGGYGGIYRAYWKGKKEEGILV